MTRRDPPPVARDTLSKALDHRRHRPELAAQAIGSTLAERVRLDEAVPARDLSAMDGYAVRAADTPGELSVAGASRPGDPWSGTLQEGQAVRVLTGGPVPDGADAVAIQEVVEGDGDRLTVPETSPGANVVPKGKAVEGREHVPAGTRLDPALAETLASQGVELVTVRDPPSVQVVPVGDEIVDGDVIDSVSPVIVSLLHRHGVPAHRLDPIPDTADALARALRTDEDLVVTIGGTGPGSRDETRDLPYGSPIVDGVHVKPGKPFHARTLPQEAVWTALPGNPTSALFTFRALVLPALLEAAGTPSACGRPSSPQTVAERLDPHRSKWHIRPVSVHPDGIRPVGDGPSLATGWWRGADGLVLLQPEEGLDPGDRTEVMYW